MRIPVNEPDLSGNEETYVLDALRSGWISGSGRYLTEFERRFAEFVGTRHAVSTTNGTAALRLALMALGLAPGDDVIVPTLTIISTILAILQVGARPVLVDSEEDTGAIDVGAIERRITRATRVIMPVHLYGHPADMGPIMELARSYDLKVVEDAAEAHGAEYCGRPAGSIGDINCFSFYANKIVTTGEGGMVTTNDDELADRASRLKDLAHSRERRFVHTEVGDTMRMTNLQAAIGVAQMERVGEFLERKRRMAASYHQALSGIPGLSLPVEKEWAKSVYWMYAVRVLPEFGGSRDELMLRLRARGVETRTFFVPMHQQPALREAGCLGHERFPVAEMLSEQGMYLPSGLTITEEQIDRVATAVREIQAELS